MLPRVMVLFLMMLGSVKGAEGVVLLHGLSRTSASMAKMERALVSEGYVVLNCEMKNRRVITSVMAFLKFGQFRGGTEPAAAPNGGPVPPSGNSGVMEWPQSVSYIKC